MTQMSIENWTARETAWPSRPKHQNRFTCKCILCGKRWTARAGERDASFSRHGEACTRYQTTLSRLVKGGIREETARRSLANSHMEQREIVGTFKSGVKCDARCQCATGHNCECSCGGANHGIGILA